MTNKYHLTVLNNNWLIECDNYKLNKQDQKTFSKVWTITFSEGVLNTKDSNILLINDADQIFYSSLRTPANVTLVDVDAYTLCESPFDSHLGTVTFRNAVDSLGYSHKLVLLDDSFEAAFEDDCFKHKYNHICVNVKSFSDLTLENIEKYFLLLEDFGCLFIQTSNDFLTEKTKVNLDHYFSLLSNKIRTSTAHGNMQIFNSYIKISSLV